MVQCGVVSSIDSSVDRCSHKETPTSQPCGRLLHKQPKHSTGHLTDSPSPTRVFVYQDFKEWLARLHTRADIEKYLECKLYTQASQSSTSRDIWDVPALQNFHGLNGKPFISVKGDEGRYIFSLNMDGFNPFGMRQAGKKASSGAIYMVCLNLPPSIRYKVENMYLAAIIPGPHEPSLHQINHLLRPLVDDLLVAWHDGIRLSKTALRPNGRIVRCAVVPLVCDLPAARQMSGFAPCTSQHCCSYCQTMLRDIENLDETTWTRRTRDEHIKIALRWRDAPTDAARSTIYDEYGIRWTELLRLPYWDPTKFTLLDSMHALLLVLIQKHCREVWGMDTQLEDGPGATYDKLITNQPPPYDLIRDGIATLRSGPVKKLQQLSENVLRYMCHELQIRFGGRKGRLINHLINYVSLSNCLFTS